jgi:hypothetical protein
MQGPIRLYSTPQGPFSSIHAPGRGPIRREINRLLKRQGAEDRIAAAQAKRDRKNAKRAQIAPADLARSA